MANHTYLECDDRFLVGSKMQLGILVWDESNPNNDISAATALCSIYNSADAAIVSSAPCGLVGTTLISLTRLWDTTGLPQGKYRVVFTVTLGQQVPKFQFAVILDSEPGPQ